MDPRNLEPEQIQMQQVRVESRPAQHILILKNLIHELKTSSLPEDKNLPQILAVYNRLAALDVANQVEYFTESFACLNRLIALNKAKQGRFYDPTFIIKKVELLLTIDQLQLAGPGKCFPTVDGQLRESKEALQKCSFKISDEEIMALQAKRLLEVQKTLQKIDEKLQHSAMQVQSAIAASQPQPSTQGILKELCKAPDSMRKSLEQVLRRETVNTSPVDESKLEEENKALKVRIAILEKTVATLTEENNRYKAQLEMIEPDRPTMRCG